MLTEATKENLRRKSGYIDQVQTRNGKPLWSWVDLSLTELCNRSAGSPKACRFCPRIDPAFYPNQSLHMPISTIYRIARELGMLEYQGVVVLCGFGEPLLHPEILNVVQTLKTWAPLCRIEMVTNGDRLGPDMARDLVKWGLDYFVVSMYDGPEQVKKFVKVFDDAEVSSDHFILRDRWHTEEDDFGLKLTNRAGTVSVGNQDPVDPTHPCHYLAYQLTVDWNGDVLLCVQDWHKKVKYGNVNVTAMTDIWNSPQMHKRRMGLIRGKRTDSPCSGCNCDGTLHGHNHVTAWEGAAGR